MDTDSLLLRWFNHWLKDTNEFANEPPIRHFALNGNQWHSAQEWPSAVGHRLFLQSGGRANSSKGDGILSAEAPGEHNVPDIFVYDPEVPVVAPGGIASNAGPYNQEVVALGNNVLVYTGPPLERPLHIFGSSRVSIYCQTSAPSSDLVVRLVCLHPTGEAQFVCIGIARSRHLFGHHYQADTNHLWNFTLEPTSCLFAEGDRIRIEIASSAYPLFDRNSGNNTPEREASSWNWQRSTQIIFHDNEHPSAIYFSVMDTATVNER